jgi:hypothetical protein
MSSSRIILAGVVGGLAMYAWMSVAHMALPLATAGISQVTNNEPALLAQMHGTLGETPGLYMFPAFGKPGDKVLSMTEYQQKLDANPSGMLIYHPPGRHALDPVQFVTEFLLEIFEAFLAVFLLAQTRLTSYGARVGFVAGLGVLASLGTNISYWNWYGFPGSYTAAYMVTQMVGFLVVGLVVAALTRQRVAQPQAVMA